MQRLTGKENIDHLNTNVLEFWSWAYSDMLNNANRGVFAEFVVAKALGLEMQASRGLWDSFDLEYKKIRMEIKSSAYLQSWYQAKNSKIIFGIEPKKFWDKETNELSKTVQRNTQIYVFCLYQEQKSKDIEKLLDMNNWHFWFLETAILNEKMPEQQTIRFNVLKKIAKKCTISTLKENIDKLIENQINLEH